MPATLHVCTTERNDETYDRLFALYEEAVHAMEHDHQVVLRFDNCTFLHQNAVAFLGGVIRMLQLNGCDVFLNRKTLRDDVRRNLMRNGFLGTLGLEASTPFTGNTIPFREDRNDQGDIIRYLREDWLGRGWVNVSDRVMDAIVSAVLEIYSNALEHGNSAVGVFTCGQRYPTLKEIALTVVDFGMGIPTTVRTVGGQASVSDNEAIAWALLRGNTSKPGNRGMGLDILREFVRVNRGRLDILSHRGHLKVAAGRQLPVDRNHFFQGTLLNITLKQDETRYHFANEPSSEDIF